MVWKMWVVQFENSKGMVMWTTCKKTTFDLLTTKK